MKKKLRTEKDFVQFDAVSSPKPLFFRKAKGSTAASPGPTLQVLAPHCYPPTQSHPRPPPVCSQPLASAAVHGLQAPVQGVRLA